MRNDQEIRLYAPESSNECDLRGQIGFEASFKCVRAAERLYRIDDSPVRSEFRRTLHEIRARRRDGDDRGNEGWQFASGVTHL